MAVASKEEQFVASVNRVNGLAGDCATIDADSVDRLRKNLGLSDVEIVRLLDLVPRTRKGRQPEPAASERRSCERLRQLEALDYRLRETFDAESVPRWLRMANRYLGDRTPLDLLLAGRFDRVDAALEALDAGIFI